ncbi:hypothetical protein [Candidatus Albibeggiatoa sp. nov. BB20]|uniref:hypothetical protein n=1 Tax=Candidatus Albibeggiatoa sp. nov. BB20 TaxID=3162723 RepID=UPI003365B093
MYENDALSLYSHILKLEQQDSPDKYEAEDYAEKLCDCIQDNDNSECGEYIYSMLIVFIVLVMLGVFLFNGVVFN